MNQRLHYIPPFRMLSSISLLLFIFCHPLSAQLTVEWDKTAGGLGWEELNTLIRTSDGGYLLGGITTSDGPYPISATKPSSISSETVLDTVGRVK